MQASDKRDPFRVDITSNGCQVPADERTRLQTLLEPVRDAARDFPAADLGVHVVYHPQSTAYHAEFKLKLPGRTLVTGDGDPYLDTALQRGVRKLVRKVESYRQNPDRVAVEQAERQAARDRDVMAPESPADTGPLAEAVQAGDYAAFRTALGGYEEWLRKRAGRWIQRYPQAQAQVGKGLLIGDLVEEVYLNAFERFPQWPTEVPLSAWLDGLLDPSLRALLRHPDEEHENASMARTAREVPAA
jgi:hypothetical protein